MSLSLFKQKFSFASHAIRDAFSTNTDAPCVGTYEIRPTIAGLPEYHKKQIDYFKDHIAKMRSSLNGAGFKLQQPNIARSKSTTKLAFFPRQNVKGDQSKAELSQEL